MSLKALNDVVLVVVDEVKDTTASGIYTGTVKTNKITGTVVEVGNTVEIVKVSDKVLLSPLTYYTFKEADITYTVCREKEVLVILE